MEINWLKATEDQRKRLYVVTRAVADAANMSVDDILDAALGRKVLMGTDYISTFRRGKIRKSYAKLIHGWIKTNHVKIASGIAPDMFFLPSTDAWGIYLDNNAIHGTLRIALFGKTSMGLVQRKRSQPNPEETLKLGEDFCFQFESEIDGYATAFQKYEGKLHPLPLGASDELATTIEIGEQFLPLDDNGHPERLSEAKDLGHHQFIIVVAENAEMLPTEMLPPEHDSRVSVHMIRIQVVV